VAIKIALIGGGGVHAPLLIHGLADSGMEISELALYDSNLNRAGIMASSPW
jgi:alpha-galactosidase/6-phospho-beta-glucosidase family protein